MDGPAGAPPQEPVTFEDVAVCFSPEEWKELVNWQKDLYKDVMRENFEMLSSLELATHKPDIISRIEQGGAQCVQRPPCPKPREGPNHIFPDAQIQIKKESCLEEVPTGQRCRAMTPEAVKGNLDNGDACGFSPWLGGHYTTPFDRNRVAALIPWPTELKWASGTMAGQEPTLVGFQVGNPGVSGGHFWPTNIAHEELLLICTQCQKCFPYPMAHRPPSVGEGTQVCPECDTRNTKDPLPLRPVASPRCTCAHCLPTPNARPRPTKEERPYKCGKCDKSFRFAHEHTWHQKVHAGEKVYKCGQCEKVFRHRQELTWHQRTHTPEWPHKCPTCQKSFRFKQELAWHLKTHSAERPYACPECGKSFRFKQEFAWHQRAHVGDRPYACPECEKTFRFKQEFAWHQRSHATEKSYKCPGCDKSFRYKQEFIWHQRIHTGEQPYPCASCDSTFTCRQEYTRHQRLHDGEKPYRCPHCEKTFRRGSTLIRHRRVHAGGGPFKCRHCERSFGQNASLARHQRMHEMEDGTKGDLSGWPPCFQGPVQTETVSVLSLKAVSVGALLFLNLQEAKQEKGRDGQPHAVWGEPQT